MNEPGHDLEDEEDDKPELEADLGEKVDTTEEYDLDQAGSLHQIGKFIHLEDSC